MYCLGIDDVFAIRAATVRERFLGTERHRFLTGAALKNAICVRHCTRNVGQMPPGSGAIRTQ